MFKKIIMLAALMALVAGCETGTKNTTKAGKTVCKVDSDCSDGNLCVDNYCAESAASCNYNFDCASGETCESGLCVSINTEPTDEDECQTDEDCTSGDICYTEGSPNVCVAGETDSSECEIDSDCTVDGQTCQDNVCAFAKGFCAVDTDCDAGYNCSADGVCISQGGGKAVTDETPEFSKNISGEFSCLIEKTIKIIATSSIENFTWTVSGLSNEFVTNGQAKAVTIKRAAGSCSDKEDKTYTFTVTACSKDDATKCFTSGEYTITVAKVEPLAIDATGCPSIDTASNSNCQLDATGGSGEYNWEISSNDILHLETCSSDTLANNCSVKGAAKKDKKQVAIKAKITDPITSFSLTKDFNITVTDKFRLSGLIPTRDSSTISIDSDSALEYEPENSVSGVITVYPSSENTTAKISGNNKDLLELTPKNGGWQIKPSAKYNGESVNFELTVCRVFELTVCRVNDKITLKFNNVSFGSYMCKAPEIKFRANGKIKDFPTLTPSKKIKGYEVWATNGWAISKVTSNAVSFKNVSNEDDNGVNFNSAGPCNGTDRELECSLNTPTQKLKMEDIGARAEFAGYINDTTISFELKKDGCTTQTIPHSVDVEYPSLGNDYLRTFIIWFGKIDSFEEASKINLTLYNGNNIIAVSEKIYFEGTGVAEDTIAIRNWHKPNDSTLRPLSDLKIRATDVTSVKYSVFDCSGAGCGEDLHLSIRAVYLLAKYHFAYATLPYDKYWEVDDSYFKRFGCFPNEKLPADPSGEKSCSSLLNFKTAANFATEAYDSVYNYIGSTTNRSETADNGWFKRQNIDASGETPELLFEKHLIGSSSGKYRKETMFFVNGKLVEINEDYHERWKDDQ